MSFILDALKKSETDRQQQGTADFAGVPTSPDRKEGAPPWMWVVGILLIVNLAVLAGIFLRPDADPASSSNEIAAEAAPTAQQTPTGRQADTPAAEGFAEQVAAARQNPPRQDDPPPAQTAPPQTRTPSVTIASEPIVDSTVASLPVTSQPATSTSASALALPTIHEVRANGAIMLPDLHVDIHVYSESAQDRFVFINMVKHNEGSRLAEGPIVDEITPEGVVLRVGETMFFLPKD